MSPRTSFLLYRWVVVAAALLGAASSVLLPPGSRRWLVASLGVVGAALWLLATIGVRPGWRYRRRRSARPGTQLLFTMVAVTAGLAAANAVIRLPTDSLLIQEGIRAVCMIPALAIAILLYWWADKVQHRRRQATPAQPPDPAADPAGQS